MCIYHFLFIVSVYTTAGVRGSYNTYFSAPRPWMNLHAMLSNDEELRISVRTLRAFIADNSVPIALMRRFWRKRQRLLLQMFAASRWRCLSTPKPCKLWHRFWKHQKLMGYVHYVKGCGTTAPTAKGKSLALLSRGTRWGHTIRSRPLA